MENFEAFKKTLVDYLEEHETNLNLWKSVKRLHKKNGEDFVHFGQNFDGAEVYNAYGLYGDDELKVSGRGTSGKWYSDYINLQIREENGNGYTHLTVTETFEVIETRIRYYEVKVANDKLQLALAENFYNRTCKAVKELYNGMLEDIKKNGYTPTCRFDTPSIMYKVRELLGATYPTYIESKEDELTAVWKR